jgi:hypothetical protein
VRRYPALLIFALALACLLGGCSATGSLKSRAAGYYSFMAGLTPKTAYSSFLSPAYRKSFKRADLDQLNKTYAKAKTPTERYPACKPENVSFALEAKFAYTVADPELGDAYRNLQPVRWVRAGNGWYLYTGSKDEIEAYGEFPGGMAPPLPPAPRPATEPAAE